MDDITSTDVVVDPGGELADPGVDPGQIRSAAACTPADDANEEPATPSWCLTGQGTPRIPLTCKQSNLELQPDRSLRVNVAELTLQASRSPEETPAHSMRGETGP